MMEKFRISSRGVIYRLRACGDFLAVAAEHRTDGFAAARAFSPRRAGNSADHSMASIRLRALTLEILERALKPVVKRDRGMPREFARRAPRRDHRSALLARPRRRIDRLARDARRRPPHPQETGGANSG